MLCVLVHVDKGRVCIFIYVYMHVTFRFIYVFLVQKASFTKYIVGLYTHVVHLKCAAQTLCVFLCVCAHVRSPADFLICV